MERVVFFYKLTEDGQRRFAHPRDVIVCLEGDPDAVAASRARRLGLLAFPQEGGLVEHRALLDLTKAVQGALERQTCLRPWLAKLYDTDEIGHYFARLLVREVDWLAAVAAVALRDFPSARTVALPPDWPHSMSWPLMLEVLREPDVRERAVAAFGLELAEMVARLKAPGRPPARRPLVHRIASALRAIIGTWLRVLRFARPRSMRLGASRVVLRTYGTDWDDVPEESGRIRRVDFLVDGEELRPDDVIVWAEPDVDEARKQRLRRRGYRVLDRRSVALGPAALLRRALPILLSFTAQLPALVRSNAWWQTHAASLVRDRIVWDELARALGPTTFVAYNDISGWATPRNLALRRRGVRTVYYQHSSGSYSELDGEWRESIVCADLVCTAFAGWGPVHLDLYRRSGSAFEEYWDVGCLWSEHARLIAEDAALRNVYAEQLGAPIDAYEKVVAVIDATITSEIARQAWLGTHEAALAAARTLPDVLFLVKPKFGLEHILAKTGDDGRDLVRRLKETPNVVVVPAAYETSAVVAFSDCVVGMPFTSVVIEAIGAGKPGFYIDPVAQFPDVSWDDVPGMLVRDAARLQGRLGELLTATPVEHLAYLREHLAHVEGHFDGRAITRLRRRILKA